MISDKISLLNHALVFSPLWILIDLGLILHFFISWYVSYKQSGWKLDFWFSFLALNILIPVLFMYPFHSSPYNFIAVGYQFSSIDSFVDKAFAITLLGYGMMWIGRIIYNMTHRVPSQKQNAFSLCIQNNILSKTALHILITITACFGLLILIMQLIHGTLFNPRSFFLENHATRPIFNLTLSFFPLAFTFLALRDIGLNELSSRILFCFFLIFSIFLGTRGILLGGIVMYVSFKAYANRGNISLYKLVLLGISCLFLIFYMESLRHGEFNPMPSIEKMIAKILYGNNFSEVRDFAWVLSSWDESYVLGKTYVAGILSFLPRFLSSYRQEWAFSIYTNSLVNFNSEVHAGLRIGLFGEPFLNFGYGGVMLIGMIGGYFLRDADLKLKRAATLIEGYSKTVLFTIITLLFSSVAAWSIYILLFLHLFFFCIRNGIPERLKGFIK